MTKHFCRISRPSKCKRRISGNKCALNRENTQIGGFEILKKSRTDKNEEQSFVKLSKKKNGRNLRHFSTNDVTKNDVRYE